VLNFFRRRTTTANRSALIPDGVRIYAIGDVHGRADLLDEMMGLIARHASLASPVACNRVILLGDVIDRGPEASAVVERLLQSALDGKFTVEVLMGNHERLMLDFLENPEVGRGWLPLGGLTTLVSYGVNPPLGTLSAERLGVMQAALIERLPAAHRRYLDSLPTSLVIGDYLFVHAGVRPNVPLERQREEDLLWIREPFLSSPNPCERVVVHGHNITSEPEILAGRIGIDTGAYRSGVLSCVVLHGAARSLLQTVSDAQKKRSPTSMISPGMTGLLGATCNSVAPFGASRRIFTSPLSAR